MLPRSYATLAYRQEKTGNGYVPILTLSLYPRYLVIANSLHFPICHFPLCNTKHSKIFQDRIKIRDLHVNSPIQFKITILVAEGLFMHCIDILLYN